MTPFRQPAVVGAGTMGIGITEILATSGISVQLVDIAEDTLDLALQKLRDRLTQRVHKGKCTVEIANAILDRIQPTCHLHDVTADIVIEAVVEDLKVKQELFRELEKVVSEDTVLASNTSSLSITSLAAVTQYPRRVVGLHFFNPATRMPLVEVIEGAQTDGQLVDRLTDWMRYLGKEPVKVMDSPGFLVNRIARPFHLEAYRLVSEGLATKEQLDRILQDAGFQMGPFALQDLIGIDVNYAASVSVYEAFFHESRFRPHPSQRQLVESGALGQKTKRGHYVYAE